MSRRHAGFAAFVGRTQGSGHEVKTTARALRLRFTYLLGGRPLSEFYLLSRAIFRLAGQFILKARAINIQRGISADRVAAR